MYNIMKFIRVSSRLCNSYLWTNFRHCCSQLNTLNKPVTKEKPIQREKVDFRSDDVLHTFNWMSKHAKPFNVYAKNITIISEPKDYYNTLKEKIKRTKFRMTLVALYLGTQHLEQELVSLITKRLKETDMIEVTILLDYTRGQRGNPNSCTMLSPILNNKNVQVSLFHTPYLRGLLKKVVPQRWNELIGLQHMKVNIFDDCLIVSGANLSNDYFTNRQDRYFVIEQCPHLCDYVHNIISTVASFSMHLNSDGSTGLHPSWTLHPFESNKDEFKSKVKEKVTSALCSPTVNDANAGDTIIYPLVQMGHFNIKQDEHVTTEFLKRCEKGSQLVLASGYFNLTDFYESIILEQTDALMKIIMAAPEANGFYGAKGVAGGIPAAYTQLAAIFYEEIVTRKLAHRIQLFEYLRKGWTFHAKGLWYYLPNENMPSLTAIGSPNFGYRSVHRDLELQLMIATSNSSFRKALHKEHQAILEKCTPVTFTSLQHSERRIPMWVEMVAYYFRDYF